MLEIRPREVEGWLLRRSFAAKVEVAQATCKSCQTMHVRDHAFAVVDDEDHLPDYLHTKPD